ncbi:MAG TPA: TraB/GumN family protein, partial [Caulobacteraceae bacterium]|nr:TraB/GumN family protein [Caulobacteraceae bacterium]
MKLGAALAAVFWFALSGAAAASPAMWVVRDADSEIYLFGTLHMLDGRLAWQTPLLQEVYEQADCIWFEADVSGDPARARSLMARYGVDPSRRLTQKLSPRLMRRLTPILQRQQISFAAVDSLRPWA